MPKSKEDQISSLRAEIGKLARSKGSCRGEPEMLKDIEDKIRKKEDQVRELQRSS